MTDTGARLSLERSSTGEEEKKDEKEEKEEEGSFAWSPCGLDDHTRVPCLVISFPSILVWGGGKQRWL